MDPAAVPRVPVGSGRTPIPVIGLGTWRVGPYPLLHQLPRPRNILSQSLQHVTSSAVLL